MQVHVVENVLKLNDELAALNRTGLRGAGVFTVNLIGGPGCGKTSLLEATTEALRDRARTAVIVGDLATTRDADRLARHCGQVVQVNTGRGCHLEAHHVRQALARLDLSGVDVLFIENVGNLVCPVGFDLGQDVKVGLFSVCQGDDKPAKYPYLVRESAVVLLNKTDLLGHLSFNRDAFRADVRELRPDADVLEISVASGRLGPWLDWLAARVPALPAGRSEPRG